MSSQERSPRRRLELEGSSGARWVHSAYERLQVLPEEGSLVGESIAHLSWNRPQADPRYAYQPIGGDGPANGWESPSCIGARIELLSSSPWPNATYELTFKTGHKHYFDSAGRIVARASRCGRDAVQFIYTARGELDEIVDARGMVFDVEASAGGITAITDPMGNRIDYTIQSGLLMQVTFPERTVHKNQLVAGAPIATDWDTVQLRRPTRKYLYNAAHQLETVKDDAQQTVISLEYVSTDPASPDSKRVQAGDQAAGLSVRRLARRCDLRREPRL
ncbi:MAG: hypothetical protein GY711_15550 [bacterium]|nr:hypothetical protein [bacterium]